MKTLSRGKNSLTGLESIKKISNDITLLTYKDKESLCKAFCRIEEYYESPFFRGLIFSLGQYREWYSTEFGAWSYYKDWSGFNIPSEAFTIFNKGMFDPLSQHEAELIDLFRYKSGKFCVIGTYEGCDSDVYEHEICHAMFNTNAIYREAVLYELDLVDGKLDGLKNHLRELGYNEFVILDECHAYICESFQYLDKKNIKYPIELKATLQNIKLLYRDKIGY